MIFLQDGTVRKFYVIPLTDKFGIVTETPGKRIISSLYRRLGCYENYIKKLAVNATAFKPEPLNVTATNLAHVMGLISVEISLAIHGCKAEPICCSHDLDSVVHDEIAQQLATLLAVTSE